MEDSYIKSTNDEDSIRMDGSGAVLDLDGDYDPPLWGYNNILKIDGQYAIYQYTDNNTSVSANGNWWGVNPPADSLFNKSGNIDYDPYSTSLNGSAGAKIAVMLANQPFSEAIDREEMGDWAGAFDIYRNIIQLDDDVRSKERAIKSMLRVIACSDRDYTEVRNIIQNELKTATSIYRATLDFILCELNVKEQNNEEAIAAFSAKVPEYRDTPMELEMLCRIAYIYGDILGDTAKAEEYANLVESKNPSCSFLIDAYKAAGMKYNP
ncbi:MAG: hypothetical protein HOC71_10090, partial [Candidatus Latescibacteria bacterium]|nr:hypothetical protein [Candidatus Latescibacterota bacterium]